MADEITVEPLLEWKVGKAGSESMRQYAVVLLANGLMVDKGYCDHLRSWGEKDVKDVKRDLLRAYHEKLKVDAGIDKETLMIAKLSGPVDKPKRRGLFRRIVAAIKES